MTPDGGQPHSAVLLSLAAELAAEHFDLAASRRRMVASAAALVPGCEWVSVTQHVRGRSVTTAADSDVALKVDEIQYGVGDGPCLTALRWNQPIAAALASDKRWPEFTLRTVAETSVRAVLSRPLIIDGMPAASVNYYGRSAALLASERAADAATGIVALATVALTHREKVDHLHKAMRSRETISAAVGILMAADRTSYEQAFQRLVAVSQQTHQKLRDVADHVLLTGAVPTSSEHH